MAPPNAPLVRQRRRGYLAGFRLVPKRQICARGLLILLTAWASVLIGPDLYRVVQPLGSLGLSVDNDGLIYATEPGVLRAGRPDDQLPALHGCLAQELSACQHVDLQAANCRTGIGDCRNILALLGGMGGMQYIETGETVTVHIRETARPVRLVAQAVKLDWPTAVMLTLATFAGLFTVFGAAYLVWTREGVLSWTFFLYAIWFNSGQYFEFYSWLQMRPIWLLVEEAAQALAQGVGYAAFLLFACRFPCETAQWPKLERLAPWIGVALVVLQIGSFANQFGYPTETVARASYIAGYLVDIAAVAIIWARWGTLSLADRQRMRWVFWGCLIGLSSFIFADINEATTLLWWHFDWARHLTEAELDFFYSLNGVLCLCIIEASRNQRVANVWSMIRHYMVPIVLAFVSATPIAFGEHRAEGLLDVLKNRPGAAFIGTVLTVVIAYILHEHLINMLDRVMNSVAHRNRAQFTCAERDMAKLTDPRDIDFVLLHVPVNVFQVESAALFRCIAGRLSRMSDAWGWAEGMVAELDLDRDTPVARSVREHRAIRVMPDDWRPGFPTGLPAPTAVVPIEWGGKTLGVALYGPHANGADLDPNERRMLQSLAEHAGIQYCIAQCSSL